MKYLKIILVFLLVSLTFHIVNAQSCNYKNVYWESLSDNLKNEIIHLGNKTVVSYYYGNFSFSDDERSVQLLNELTLIPQNTGVKALNFFLFNKICLDADGAIAEMLGNYCQKVLINDPIYVLNYFSSHNLIMEKYATLLGYELYFAEEGVSDIRYNFDDFKKQIFKKLDNNESLKKTFNDLIDKIEKAMGNMD